MSRVIESRTFEGGIGVSERDSEYVVRGREELSGLILALMVVLAAIAMAGTLPGRTHGMGLVAEGILADLNLDRLAFAQLNLVATLVGAVFCWPCGWLVDRFGLRSTSFLILLILGLCTLGTAMNWSISGLWILTTLTRGFGQSMLSIISITLIGKSSIGKHQPMAMACYSLLVALLFIAAFQLMGILIPAYGWRWAWSLVGWFLIAVSPFFLILVSEVRSHSKNAIDTLVRSATLAEALRTYAFWIFAISSGLYAFVSSGLSLFNQSILREHSFRDEVFYQLLTVSTIAGAVSNLLAGWLARRVPYRRLLAAAMATYTMALLCFPWIRTESGVYLYGIAMGASGGIITVVFFGVWSYAYGREHLGKIQGLAQFSTVIASAVGPLFFAQCLKEFGSYQPAFWGLAPVVAVLSVLAWIVPTPRAALTPGKSSN